MVKGAEGMWKHMDIFEVGTVVEVNFLVTVSASSFHVDERAERYGDRLEQTPSLLK